MRPVEMYYELISIAEASRAQAEKAWRGWDVYCSIGQCRWSTALLAKNIRKHGFDAKEAEGYYTDVNAAWLKMAGIKKRYFQGVNHHFAVVNNLFIVDITADQFHPGDRGWTVVITSIDDTSYIDWCLK